MSIHNTHKLRPFQSWPMRYSSSVIALQPTRRSSSCCENSLALLYSTIAQPRVHSSGRWTFPYSCVVRGVSDVGETCRCHDGRHPSLYQVLRQSVELRFRLGVPATLEEESKAIAKGDRIADQFLQLSSKSLDAWIAALCWRLVDSRVSMGMWFGRRTSSTGESSVRLFCCGLYVFIYILWCSMSGDMFIK